VISVMSGPTSALTAATSWGEQTGRGRRRRDGQGGEPAHGVANRASHTDLIKDPRC
jgi:hypothetical protein